MADHKIQFTLGGIYHGEAFDKCIATTSKLCGSVRQGIESASKMANAFDGLDASAMKSIQAVTGMMQALMSFNAASIITQAGLLVVNKMCAELNQQAAAITEKMNALKTSASDALAKSLKDAVGGVNAEIKNLSTQFDRVTKRANDLAAAMNGVRTAQASGGIVALETEKLRALLEANSEAQRQTTEATYALKEAEMRLANTTDESNAKVAAASQARMDAEDRIAMIDTQIAMAKNRREELEDAMQMAKENSDESWIKIQDEVIKLKQKEAELAQTKLDATDALTIAEKKLEQTIIERDTAVEDAKNGVLKATLAEQKLHESLNERRQAEDEAAAKARAKAARDAEIAAIHEEQRDAQTAVNESAEALKTAQDEYAEALRQYKANWSDNKLYEALYGSPTRALGSAFYGMNASAVSKEMIEQAVEDAIANGEVRTVKDLDKFERDRQEKAYETLSRIQAQIGREKQAYDRIQEHSRKTWSQQDEKFVEKFEKLRDHALAAKKDLEAKAAKAAMEESRKAKNAENLEAIAKRLKDLGLK